MCGQSEKEVKEGNLRLKDEKRSLTSMNSSRGVR